MKKNIVIAIGIMFLVLSNLYIQSSISDFKDNAVDLIYNNEDLSDVQVAIILKQTENVNFAGLVYLCASTVAALFMITISVIP